MLPGRTYTPEDILQILRRRIWWLAVPLALGAAAASVTVAFVLPVRYRSDALILVTPQQPSAAYLNPTVNTNIRDRLQASATRILSRSQLERLIVDLDLYVEEQQTMLFEDVSNMMRNRIEVVPVGNRGDAFRVSFTHNDPRVAQRVNDQLARLFIDQSELERSNTALGTSQFFEDMLEDAGLQLEQMEQQLAEFRRTHNGELPEQLQSNMQVLQGLQLQIRTTLDSLDRDLDRRMLLERQLAELEGQGPIRATAPIGGATTTPQAGQPSPTAVSLAQARAALAALRTSGKGPNHPDVQAQEKLIRDLEAKVEAEALATPLSVAGTVGLPQAEIDRQKSLATTRADLDQLALTIASKEQDIERLRRDEEIYTQRVNMAPTRQTELIKITRDYDTIKRRYETLLDKKEDARIAAQQEQQGENFALLDAASLPERPISPDRSLITLMGMGGGAGFGMALILLFEYRDRGFKTDSDVARILSLPVLAVVPFMQSDRDLRRSRRRRWILHMGFGSVVAGCMAFVAYTFIR